MASVMGLPEARETAAQVRVAELREEVERVPAELAEAEVVLERRAIACVGWPRPWAHRSRGPNSRRSRRWLW